MIKMQHVILFALDKEITIFAEKIVHIIHWQCFQVSYARANLPKR